MGIKLSQENFPPQRKAQCEKQNAKKGGDFPSFEEDFFCIRPTTEDSPEESL